MKKSFFTKTLFFVSFAALIFSACDSNSDSKSGAKTNFQDEKMYVKDSRDGNVYRTVRIGSQIWMAENLNYAYKQPTATKDSSSFCFNNNPAFCKKYGRLYLWSAAMDSAGIFSTNSKGCGNRVLCNYATSVRGVCPEGWHVPNVAEFAVLMESAGDDNFVGRRLKSRSGWESRNDKQKNGNGSDDYGFSAIPTGFYRSEGKYKNGGFFASGSYFWSANSRNYIFAKTMEIDVDESAYESYQDKSIAVAVRCVKD
jgi:uncharacterized protein (TIGR02145 family)